ncbi:MAG: ubiquinol-cytochrome c reductase iron-sulfur subunit [Elusimicrobia bacterium]|nr:ubiquinol-cytochrome c reductase iron-sulfur subunit [Elusimicrobiota bacterium]
MSDRPGEQAPITRRSFLGWAIGALGAAIAAVLGASGLGYFVSPAFTKREEDWVDVGPAKGFAANVPAKVDFVERKRDAWATVEKRSSAWVLTPNGQDFIAFDPRCTHLGCPYRFDEQTKKFLCPCHTAVFDVDGRVVSGPPPRPLDRYGVKVVGGRLLVRPAAGGEAGA